MSAIASISLQRTIAGGVVTLLGFGLACPAQAQLGPLLFGKFIEPGSADEDKGVSAKYRDNNEIRAEASVPRGESESKPFAMTMRTIARMAKAKGYDRIAMTKQNCYTMLMYNSPISHSCRILATMVRPGEVAKAKSSNPVRYYDTDLILAGIITPEGSEMMQKLEAAVPDYRQRKAAWGATGTVNEKNAPELAGFFGARNAETIAALRKLVETSKIKLPEKGTISFNGGPEIDVADLRGDTPSTQADTSDPVATVSSGTASTTTVAITAPADRATAKMSAVAGAATDLKEVAAVNQVDKVAAKPEPAKVAPPPVPAPAIAKPTTPVVSPTSGAATTPQPVKTIPAPPAPVAAAPRPVPMAPPAPQRVRPDFSPVVLTPPSGNQTSTSNNPGVVIQ